MIYEKVRSVWQNWVARAVAFLVIAVGIKWINLAGPGAILIYIVFELAVLQDLPAITEKKGFSLRQKIEMIVGLLVILLFLVASFYKEEITNKVNDQVYPLIATPVDGI